MDLKNLKNSLDSLMKQHDTLFDMLTDEQKRMIEESKKRMFKASNEAELKDIEASELKMYKDKFKDL